MSLVSKLRVKLEARPSNQLYLISRADDKHSPQDETLAVHVALVTGPPGPYKVLPHSQTDEGQSPHLPLKWAVEVFLQEQGHVVDCNSYKTSQGIIVL